MRRKTLVGVLLVCLVFLAIDICTAQTVEEWNKAFGGTEDDRGKSVAQTSDDGYIIAGETDSYGAGEEDIWLIKTDSNGNKMWSKTFGGTHRDYGHSIAQTSDRGYIITGTTFSYGAGRWDVWLIKTDSNGNEIWNKTFGGADSDSAFSVAQTSDEGYIITGVTGLYTTERSDVWLIKTDSNGNKMWSKTFGGTDDDSGESVAQTSDGGYIITGFTESYGTGSCDVWLIKTDSKGNKIWDKTFGGTDCDRGYSIAQTSDGGYIITGDTKSYGAGSWDVWLIKVGAIETPERPTPKNKIPGFELAFTIVGLLAVAYLLRRRK